MAKRYKRKGMKKTQPAEMTMYFPLPSPSLPGTSRTDYIDLSQVASLINRRFYRQGINWSVAGFKVLSTANSTGFIGISKIPTTWVAGNAWQKAFAMWNKQQMEAVDDAGSSTAVSGFRDFKVFADEDHANSGVVNNLLPYSIGNILATPGMWEASQIVLPNTAAGPGGDLVEPSERFLHMCGINVNGTVSRGIIEGYADSRAFPQSPDPVSPDIDSAQNWMARMFDDGNDINVVLENATDRNDELPYPQVDYPGGAGQLESLMLHDLTFISNTTVGGTSYLKGGNFPCGIIRVDQTRSEGDLSLQLLIDLVPGSHRGYHCEPMSEM